MCSPAFVDSGRVMPGHPESLREDDLIHVQWRTGFSTFPSWELWFEAAQAPRSAPADRGHRTDSATVALALAAAGAGIVLGQFLLAEEALQTGKLVTPFDIAPALSFRYCAVQTAAGMRNPSSQTLHRLAFGTLKGSLVFLRRLPPFLTVQAHPRC
jgi:DNA-binding transcriptional LysR family regulator